MKKVLLSVPEAKMVVTIDEVSTSKYYAYRNRDTVGIITSDSYFGGIYNVRSTCSFTEFNSLGFESRTLSGCIERILSKETTDREVFEFDTAQELFKWLSEQKNA